MCTISFVVTMVLFGTTVYLPLFLQLVTGAGPTVSGLLLVPQVLGTLTGGVIVGRKVAKSGKYRNFPIVGACILPVGMFLFSRMTPSTPHLVTSFFLLVNGVAVGLIIPVSVTIVRTRTDQKDLGVATSSMTFFRSMGSSFGVAIFGCGDERPTAVLVPALCARSRQRSPPSDFSRLQSAAVAKLPPAVRHGVIEAFGHSLHVVFLIAGPIALCVLPFALLLKEIPLRSKAYIQTTSTLGDGPELPTGDEGDGSPNRSDPGANDGVVANSNSSG